MCYVRHIHIYIHIHPHWCASATGCTSTFRAALNFRLLREFHLELLKIPAACCINATLPSIIFCTSSTSTTRHPALGTRHWPSDLRPTNGIPNSNFLLHCYVLHIILCTHSHTHTQTSVQAEHITVENAANIFGRLTAGAE